MIAADALRPHQKPFPLGISSPDRSYLRPLFSCSSHIAGVELWWLALSPPTSPGCSAGDRVERTEGTEGGVGGME